MGRSFASVTARIAGRVAISVTAIGLSGGSALAQDDTDTAQTNNIQANVIPNSPADVEWVRSFAQCAGGDRGAVDLLRLLPASQQSDRSLFFMTDSHPSCEKRHDRYVFSVRNYRGILAEYLLKNDFDLSSWKPRGTPAKTFPAPSNDQLAKLPADSRSAIVMTEIGTCVTAAAPMEVAALLASEASTPAENTAFAAVVPALGGCIPPGVEMKISKFQLRGYLAEGAYRYAVALAGEAK